MPPSFNTTKDPPDLRSNERGFAVGFAVPIAARPQKFLSATLEVHIAQQDGFFMQLHHVSVNDLKNMARHGPRVFRRSR